MAALLSTDDWQVLTYESAVDFAAASATLQPGLLLLDLRLPGTGGLELLESGDVQLRPFGVVVVTGHGEVHTAVRALKAGAMDYIEKPFGEEILDTLGDLYRRYSSNSTNSAEKVSAAELVSTLSARELQVLRHLANGSSSKIAGHDLGISPRTVEMHRARMMQKLRVKNSSEAVRVGVLAGVG